MKKTRKQYTSEFNAQIIELVGAGRSVPEVAEDFEVEASCVYAWTRDIRMRRLRRENAELKLDNEILKKAAVIIGTKHQPNGAR